jgi:CheY-like chemotaxis protein
LADSTAAAPLQGPPPRALASILVADDDPGLVGVLSIAFKAAGYKVTTAPDGTKGLAAVEQARFDVLVLDVLMPGATGWEVLQSAIDRTPLGKALPRAIMMTGFNQEYVVDMSLLRREGVSAMLLKPFPASLLVDEVRRALVMSPQFALPRAPQRTTA